MSASHTISLSAAEVLHHLELQENFKDEHYVDLDKESCDEYHAEKDFYGSDGREILIECDGLTDKGYFALSQVKTAAGQDSLLLLDTEVREAASGDQGTL